MATNQEWRHIWVNSSGVQEVNLSSNKINSWRADKQFHKLIDTEKLFIFVYGGQLYINVRKEDQP